MILLASRNRAAMCVTPQLTHFSRVSVAQERVERLFLLKSTPLDKLPKKLFAKK